MEESQIRREITQAVGRAYKHESNKHKQHDIHLTSQFIEEATQAIMGMLGIESVVDKKFVDAIPGSVEV